MIAAATVALSLAGIAAHMAGPGLAAAVAQPLMLSESTRLDEDPGIQIGFVNVFFQSQQIHGIGLDSSAPSRFSASDVPGVLLSSSSSLSGTLPADQYQPCTVFGPYGQLQTFGTDSADISASAADAESLLTLGENFDRTARGLAGMEPGGSGSYVEDSSLEYVPAMSSDQMFNKGSGASRGFRVGIDVEGGWSPNRKSKPSGILPGDGYGMTEAFR